MIINKITLLKIFVNKKQKLESICCENQMILFFIKTFTIFIIW